MRPLPSRLSSGIWHTTHPLRCASILSSGLKSEPDIPDSERWKASRGPEFHPLVRKLGGVSLFDFTAFDAETYSQSHPLSSWSTFVPHRTDWGGAAWFEIDPNPIRDRFVSADELVTR